MQVQVRLVGQGKSTPTVEPAEEACEVHHMQFVVGLTPLVPAEVVGMEDCQARTLVHMAAVRDC